MLIEEAITLYAAMGGLQALGKPWPLVDRIGLEQQLAEGTARLERQLSEEEAPYTHHLRSATGALVRVRMVDGDRELPLLSNKSVDTFLQAADGIRGMVKALQRYVYVEEQNYLPVPLEFWGLPVYVDRQQRTIGTVRDGRFTPIKEEEFDGLTYAET